MSGYDEGEKKTQDTKPTSKSKLKKDVGKPGYCDCCSVRYKDLKKHLKSNQHEIFACNDSNFKGVDDLIRKGKSFETLLADMLNLALLKNNRNFDQLCTSEADPVPTMIIQKDENKDCPLDEVTKQHRVVNYFEVHTEEGTIPEAKSTAIEMIKSPGKVLISAADQNVCISSPYRDGNEILNTKESVDAIPHSAITMKLDSPIKSPRRSLRIHNTYTTNLSVTAGAVPTGEINVGRHNSNIHAADKTRQKLPKEKYDVCDNFLMAFASTPRKKELKTNFSKCYLSYDEESINTYQSKKQRNHNQSDNADIYNEVFLPVSRASFTKEIKTGTNSLRKVKTNVPRSFNIRNSAENSSFSGNQDNIASSGRDQQLQCCRQTLSRNITNSRKQSKNKLSLIEDVSNVMSPVSTEKFVSLKKLAFSKESAPFEWSSRSPVGRKVKRESRRTIVASSSQSRNLSSRLDVNDSSELDYAEIFKGEVCRSEKGTKKESQLVATQDALKDHLSNSANDCCLETPERLSEFPKSREDEAEPNNLHMEIDPDISFNTQQNPLLLSSGKLQVKAAKSVPFSNKENRLGKQMLGSIDECSCNSSGRKPLFETAAQSSISTTICVNSEDNSGKVSVCAENVVVPIQDTTILGGNISIPGGNKAMSGGNVLLESILKESPAERSMRLSFFEENFKDDDEEGIRCLLGYETDGTEIYCDENTCCANHRKTAISFSDDEAIDLDCISQVSIGINSEEFEVNDSVSASILKLGSTPEGRSQEQKLKRQRGVGSTERIPRSPLSCKDNLRSGTTPERKPLSETKSTDIMLSPAVTYPCKCSHKAKKKLAIEGDIPGIKQVAFCETDTSDTVRSRKRSRTDSQSKGSNKQEILAEKHCKRTRTENNGIPDIIDVMKESHVKNTLDYQSAPALAKEIDKFGVMLCDRIKFGSRRAGDRSINPSVTCSLTSHRKDQFNSRTVKNGTVVRNLTKRSLVKTKKLQTKSRKGEKFRIMNAAVLPCKKNVSKSDCKSRIISTSTSPSASNFINGTSSIEKSLRTSPRKHVQHLTSISRNKFHESKLKKRNPFNLSASEFISSENSSYKEFDFTVDELDKPVYSFVNIERRLATDNGNNCDDDLFAFSSP